MNSSLLVARRAGAAAFLMAFTNHCGDAQSGGQPSGTLTAPAVGGATSTASVSGSSGSAGTAGLMTLAAAGQGGAAASVRGPTSARAGASGSTDAAGSSPVGGATGAIAPAAAPLGSGTGGNAAAGAGSASTVNAVTMDWPAVADFSMKGTFTAVTENNTGPMNAYTLYYPKEQGRDGLKHPSVTWGNGATTTPNLFSLLPLLASHGFVVIAANNSFVTSAEMKSGLDWLMDENEREGSVLHQMLDPNKLAAMGYSLGSMGAFEMAGDPRLKTTVHISGGAMDKAVLPNLHKPAAFFCGDSSDIAYENCESDFEMVKVPVFYGVFPGDHLGILGSYATQINEAVATWLRWRLMDDATLDMSFVGKDCAVCRDDRWLVKQHELDTTP